MVNKKLVSTGIILALIGSNCIIGKSYITDNHNNERLIKNQSQDIQQLESNIRQQSELIKSKEIDIGVLRNQLNTLQINLNKVTEENKQLKKLIAERKEVNKQRQLNMELTFYVADCNGCSGITKTGINVSNTIYYKGYHVVAADPRVIPLHSIIRIETKQESYTAYVADTGGAIKGSILDVLVSSRQEAFKKGRQQAIVTIIREGGS